MMRVVGLLLLSLALSCGTTIESELLKEAERSSSHCPVGSSGFECRRKVRCDLRHAACEGHCRKTKGKDACTDICFRHMVKRACNHCTNPRCRRKRAHCFTEVKLCQARCKTAKCRSHCRCHKHFNSHHKKKKGHAKHGCPVGSAGYNCRRKHRCHLRHKACHASCKKHKKSRSQCRDVCYSHLKKRACNSCHDTKCRNARAICFKDLKMCQAKCSSTKCRQDCRCSAVHHPKKPHKAAGTKCPKGAAGHNCRRLQKCRQRHHACHKHCISTGKLPGQCKDLCYVHMKKHACNGCHDDACRVERRKCFSELKSCQSKCSTGACRNACKCSLTKPVKPKTPPKATPPHTAKPVKPHVPHVDNTCHCARRVQVCKFHKECELRTPVRVKKCVEEAMTKIVYCQCEQYDKKGVCIKKKMEDMCVAHDANGKCTKSEKRCKPICHKEKCLQSERVPGKKKKLHCLKSLCEKEDATHALRCVKHELQYDYKCTKAGYSHTCEWKCEEKKCGNKIQHLLAHTHELTHAPALNGMEAVKIYDHAGKQLSEADLHALAVKDPKQFQQILKSMEQAESATHNANQAQEIKMAEARLEAFGR